TQKAIDEFAAKKHQGSEITDKTPRAGNLLEIGAAKMDNQIGRNKWEDLIELYCITEHHHTLSDLLKALVNIILRCRKSNASWHYGKIWSFHHH
ncbi:MAG: hypothetical protein ACK5R0_13895, partial [Bacteroidota bacterium]